MILQTFPENNVSEACRNGFFAAFDGAENNLIIKLFAFEAIRECGRRPFFDNENRQNGHFTSKNFTESGRKSLFYVVMTCGLLPVLMILTACCLYNKPLRIREIFPESITAGYNRPDYELFFMAFPVKNFGNKHCFIICCHVVT